MLKSHLVEVAWQNISGKRPAPEDKHYHKNSIEINIVLSGWIECKINGKKVKVNAEEFFVVYPFTVVEEFAAGDNTELIVIRAPSIPDDKVNL